MFDSPCYRLRDCPAVLTDLDIFKLEADGLLPPEGHPTRIPSRALSRWLFMCSNWAQTAGPESERWLPPSVLMTLEDFARVMRTRLSNLAQKRVGRACDGGTSWAHSGSSFSVRFTFALTGYFFIDRASNGARRSIMRAGAVTPGSSHRS